MKKLIAIILILALLLPAAVLAEGYSPALGMRLNDFLLQYNAISAPLGSPYEKVANSYDFSVTSEYTFSWYKPAKDSSVVMFLGTKEKGAVNYGIDLIQIGTKKSEELIDLIAIATRCADIFAFDLLGTKMTGMQINSALRYYYENGFKGTGMMSYAGLDSDGKYVISFFKQDGWYYFQISTMEALQ
ncbi:MAG: hypothetical protein IKG23_08560 [Clostridia bacterium]|nr:hypothetical protein [Clostridia bacterium]